jgi:hypothetical protein
MALGLFNTIVAFVFWAIDTRILWLVLFVFLPQRTFDLPPSQDPSTVLKRCAVIWNSPKTAAGR